MTKVRWRKLTKVRWRKILPVVLGLWLYAMVVVVVYEAFFRHDYIIKTSNGTIVLSDEPPVPCTEQ